MPESTIPARLRDWPERLAELVQARLREPFAWGSNDCCIFAADVVQALTGHDPAAELRGAYDGPVSAARALAGQQPAELAAGVLGQALDSPAMAQRGDVVCGLVDGQQRLGVCVGELWCGPGEDGLVFEPMSTAWQAWRV